LLLTLSVSGTAQTVNLTAFTTADTPELAPAKQITSASKCAVNVLLEKSAQEEQGIKTCMYAAKITSAGNPAQYQAAEIPVSAQWTTLNLSITAVKPSTPVWKNAWPMTTVEELVQLTIRSHMTDTTVDSRTARSPAACLDARLHVPLMTIFTTSPKLLCIFVKINICVKVCAKRMECVMSRLRHLKGFGIMGKIHFSTDIQKFQQKKSAASFLLVLGSGRIPGHINAASQLIVVQ